MDHTHADRLVQREPSSYPMLRAGGAFLVCIGLGLLGAIVFSGDVLVNYHVFFGGVGAGVLSLFFAKRLSTGRPTRTQIIALAGAILLEGLLLAVMGRTLPPGTEEHIRWLWVSAIVGIHFLPMSLCFGPRFFALGIACIANAAAGLVLTRLPYEFFGVIDGLLKVGCGVWSLSARDDVA